MGSHQQFCLRWNNHQSNLLNVFEELLEQETLVDVTLACEGLSLKAHKVVLSACSPYFQSLFASNPCKHPIVILKDVKYADLKSVVDFMYRGEINVVHDQLDALLKVADTLQVKGLAEVTESFCLSRERNSASKTSTGNGAAVADRNTVHRTSKSTATTRSSQPPPSPPAVKRRKKSHKGASCGVGTSAAAVATVEEADATIMPETEAFPLLVKEENVCGLYRSRSCSNSGGGGGGGEDEVVGNHLMASTSQPVDNVQSELSMVAGAALQACEANAAVSNEAVLNATYREHLSIEMAAAAASSSSADASNLPADMLDEEVDDSVYYPSTSMSALDASMSGDASLGAINSPCAPAKGSVHVKVDGSHKSSKQRTSHTGHVYDESYTERMESACLAVAGGLSFRKAALRYSLNAPTVWRYYVRAGRPQLYGWPLIKRNKNRSQWVNLD